ncbi:hypothetical protein FRB98_008247 [Tulasnella sp. 332]|nr:hypothetical protein FRB98_008247 [Tulasnella sp. 332]
MNPEPNSTVLFDCYVVYNSDPTLLSVTHTEIERGKDHPTLLSYLSLWESDSSDSPTPVTLLIRRYYWNLQRPQPIDTLSPATSTPAMHDQGASEYELVHLFTPYGVGEGTQTSWPVDHRGSMLTTPEPRPRSRRLSVTIVPTVIIMPEMLLGPVAGTMRADAPPRITIERDAEDTMSLPNRLHPLYPSSSRDASGPSDPSQFVPSNPRFSSSSSLPHIRPLLSPTVESALRPLMPPRDQDAIPLIPAEIKGRGMISVDAR